MLLRRSSKNLGAHFNTSIDFNRLPCAFCDLCTDAIMVQPSAAFAAAASSRFPDDVGAYNGGRNTELGIYPFLILFQE